MAKTGPKRSFNPPKEELEALYQEMSGRKIADHYGVGETVVWKRLKEHGIALYGFQSGGHRKKTGREFTRQHRENLSKAHRGRWAGSKNPNWKGGVHEKNMELRRSGQYRQWKLASRERAGNKCEECGVEHGSVCRCCGTKIGLHVHHIRSFAKNPELRFDPENSRVLCPKCHHCSHHGKTA